MAEVFAIDDRRARKNLAVVFGAIKSKGQVNLARALGVSESSISETWMETWFPRFARALSFLGLKIVPQEVRCYKPEDIDPYIQLAKQRMMQIENIQSLTFDDDTDIQLGRG